MYVTRNGLPGFLGGQHVIDESVYPVDSGSAPIVGWALRTGVLGEL